MGAFFVSPYMMSFRLLGFPHAVSLKNIAIVQFWLFHALLLKHFIASLFMLLYLHLICLVSFCYCITYRKANVLSKLKNYFCTWGPKK